MRSRLIEVGVAAALASVTCGGTVVLEPPDDQGGGGASTASSTTTNATVTTGPVPDGPGPTVAATTVAASTGTGPMSCIHCADLLAGADPLSGTCPASQLYYELLAECACNACSGACKDFCGGGIVTPKCSECASDMGMGSCAAPLYACLSDT